MPALVNLPLPEFIRFGREICGDLAQAERREWWLANGLGGYAAGTIAGSLTRRYHGLLIAPVNPPLGRHLVFAKAEAVLHDGEREWELGDQPLGGRRGGAAGTRAHRIVSPRGSHAGVAVRRRRVASRTAYLDGAGRPYDLRRLAPGQPGAATKRRRGCGCGFWSTRATITAAPVPGISTR